MAMVKCALGRDSGLESRAKWTMKKLYDYTLTHSHSTRSPPPRLGSSLGRESEKRKHWLL